jgi:uroporphyrinogen-III decarboxylase
VRAYSDTGLFERLVAFMGFVDGLVALVTEPEKCMEFFDALADYKIKCIDLLIDAYQPDQLLYFDDVAMARGLFMSPQTWREVIKPFHAKIAKAVTDRGVVFAQHTCGKCEEILEDYVEMGAKIWQAAQVMNDIEGILVKFRGRLSVEGGWDSQGIPGSPYSTIEDCRAETLRCLKQYGGKGGYVFSASTMNEQGRRVPFEGNDPRGPAILDEWKKNRGL